MKKYEVWTGNWQDGPNSSVPILLGTMYASSFTEACAAVCLDSHSSVLGVDYSYGVRLFPNKDNADNSEQGSGYFKQLDGVVYRALDEIYPTATGLYGKPL